MKIRCHIKNVYGEDKLYPLDNIADLKLLTGTTTLLPRHLKALRNIGIEIQLVEQPRELNKRYNI